MKTDLIVNPTCFGNRQPLSGGHARSTANLLLTVYVILHGPWNPEEKDDTFLRNVEKHPAMKRTHPRRKFSTTPHKNPTPLIVQII